MGAHSEGVTSRVTTKAGLRSDQLIRIMDGVAEIGSEPWRR